MKSVPLQDKPLTLFPHNYVKFWIPISSLRISYILFSWIPEVPITVATRSKAWTVFARSTLGSWIRIPLKAWMFVYVYSVFVLSCVGSGLATGWSPVQLVLPNVLGLRNWSETKRFIDALCFKVGATGKRKREKYLSTEAESSLWNVVLS
jgi:hypothetical protein